MAQLQSGAQTRAGAKGHIGNNRGPKLQECGSRVGSRLLWRELEGKSDLTLTALFIGLKLREQNQSVPWTFSAEDDAFSLQLTPNAVAVRVL